MKWKAILFITALMGIPLVAEASNNSGAVVQLCIDINQPSYRGNTFYAVPFSLTGMNTGGNWTEIKVPLDAQFGIPFCSSLGYVEEDSSAPTAQWGVFVVDDYEALSATVITSWNNQNTAKIITNPQLNAFFCSSATPSCLINRKDSISWQKETTGPIYLFVDLDLDR